MRVTRYEVADCENKIPTVLLDTRDRAVAMDWKEYVEGLELTERIIKRSAKALVQSSTSLDGEPYERSIR